MQVVRDDVDYQAFLAEPEAKVRVKNALDYCDNLIESFINPDVIHGVPLPWSKTHDQFRLREHELTFWPGFNGHGKSLVLGQIMLHAMAHGQRVMIASMEMTPVATLKRMCKQALMRHNPSPYEVTEFSTWTDNKLWIFDHIGSVDWKHLIGVMRYAHVTYGINQFVIDSLMRCGIANDDYNAQKSFVDALCTFRLDYPVHVHLVAHSRKREDEFNPPGKYDMKGSGSMSDLADNVITVFRNKKKEKEMEKGNRKVVDDPDAFLICDKQRHYEWEGSISLWYVPGAMQFVECTLCKPKDPRVKA